MHPFAYAAAPSAHAAVTHTAERRGAEFIAGGTDMLQLLQEHVRAPEELIDINRLPLGGIETGPFGVRIGALARMTEVANDPAIREHFPVVREALLSGASPQVRNMASIGGNLLQRTRCLYFRDVTTPCNRRVPGAGCAALDGENRMHAILGGSAHCIATYPGDFAVALAALAAQVEIHGAHGDRTVPVEDLHRPPDDAPDIETVLVPGDLITGVVIPAARVARRSHYLKVRDRASFEFALASAAVAVETDGDTVRDVRVAVGGVATTPLRLRHVEQLLLGRRLGAAEIRAAAARAAAGAHPRSRNGFKVRLLQRTVERALQVLAGRP